MKMTAKVILKVNLQQNGPIRHVETCLIFFFSSARVHTTKSTVKILAANTHCKYFLKITELCLYCILPDPWRMSTPSRAESSMQHAIRLIHPRGMLQRSRRDCTKDCTNLLVQAVPRTEKDE
jgi:hypothetical protein